MRIDLPGGSWAELRDVESLTGSDQDAVFDLYDEIMASKPPAEPQPDPSNPAVMLPAAERRLTSADNRVLRDKILGLVISAWSFDLPLPYSSASRAQLPVRVCNALVTAAEPMQAALFGAEDEEDPKAGESPGSGGSTGTSQESTASPLPVPPAAPSGTP